MEDKKRQLTAEIQQMSQMRDELCEMIEEHKRSTECIIGNTQDVKPKVIANGKVVNVIPTANTVASTSLQRPTNFATTLNNNNNNLIANANNKLSLKIKAEPIEEFYEDEPPSKKRCEM
jgi:hypothetical protein